MSGPTRRSSQIIMRSRSFPFASCVKSHESTSDAFAFKGSLGSCVLGDFVLGRPRFFVVELLSEDERVKSIGIMTGFAGVAVTGRLGTNLDALGNDSSDSP